MKELQKRSGGVRNGGKKELPINVVLKKKPHCISVSREAAAYHLESQQRCDSNPKKAMRGRVTGATFYIY